MMAVVIGGAACVWDDLRALGPFEGLVIVVNDMLHSYPHRVDHMATLHPDKLPYWQEKRPGPKDYETWSTKPHPRVDHRIPNWAAGSSGMLAVVVALDHLKCDEVILCGVPLDPAQSHFFDKKAWTAAVHHRKAWTKNLDRMRGRVFSVSGWTRELLGPPKCLAANADAA